MPVRFRLPAPRSSFSSTAQTRPSPDEGGFFVVALTAIDANLVLSCFTAFLVADLATPDAVIHSFRQCQLAIFAITALQPFPLRKSALKLIGKNSLSFRLALRSGNRFAPALRRSVDRRRRVQVERAGDIRGPARRNRFELDGGLWDWQDRGARRWRQTDRGKYRKRRQKSQPSALLNNGYASLLLFDHEEGIGIVTGIDIQGILVFP